jgi:hypothetical protein
VTPRVKVTGMETMKAAVTLKAVWTATAMETGMETRTAKVTARVADRRRRI